MNVSSLENTPVQNPAGQLARLSGPHGYRFDGDTVHLNAMFALLNPAAHDCSWALQLWACPSAPVTAQDLAGHIVAEVGGGGDLDSHLRGGSGDRMAHLAPCSV